MLAASLGGPVWTLATFGDKGPALLEAFARELDLTAPPIAWHALRGRMAETGAWIALMISSAMPNKPNHVSSTVIMA